MHSPFPPLAREGRSEACRSSFRRLTPFRQVRRLCERDGEGALAHQANRTAFRSFREVCGDSMHHRRYLLNIEGVEAQERHPFEAQFRTGRLTSSIGCFTLVPVVNSFCRSAHSCFCLILRGTAAICISLCRLGLRVVSLPGRRTCHRGGGSTRDSAVALESQASCTPDRRSALSSASGRRSCRAARKGQTRQHGRQKENLCISGRAPGRIRDAL